MMCAYVRASAYCTSIDFLSARVCVRLCVRVIFRWCAFWTVNNLIEIYIYLYSCHTKNFFYFFSFFYISVLDERHIWVNRCCYTIKRPPNGNTPCAYISICILYIYLLCHTSLFTNKSDLYHFSFMFYKQ